MITHQTTIRVRYADTDKMKIVYNAMYLVYFEVGRTEMLRACGIPYAELEEQGYLLPVLEAFVKYRSPALYDDVLEVASSLDEQPRSTLRIEYVIRRGETEIVNGYTIHSFVKADTMRPVKPPKLYTETIEGYVRMNK